MHSHMCIASMVCGCRYCACQEDTGTFIMPMSRDMYTPDAALGDLAYAVMMESRHPSVLNIPDKLRRCDIGRHLRMLKKTVFACVVMLWS